MDRDRVSFLFADIGFDGVNDVISILRVKHLDIGIAGTSKYRPVFPSIFFISLFISKKTSFAHTEKA